MGAVFACNTVATVLATPLCGYLGNLPWLRRWAVVTLGLLQLGVGPSFAYFPCCTPSARAGIEWRRCHRAVCMAHGEPRHSGRAES